MSWAHSSSVGQGILGSDDALRPPRTGDAARPRSGRHLGEPFAPSAVWLLGHQDAVRELQPLRPRELCLDRGVPESSCGEAGSTLGDTLVGRSPCTTRCMSNILMSGLRTSELCASFCRMAAAMDSPDSEGPCDVQDIADKGSGQTGRGKGRASRHTSGGSKWGKEGEEGEGGCRAGASPWRRVGSGTHLGSGPGGDRQAIVERESEAVDEVVEQDDRAHRPPQPTQVLDTQSPVADTGVAVEALREYAAVGVKEVEDGVRVGLA